MSSFIECLERKARQIKAVTNLDKWEKSIPSMLRREIVLIVDQIDQARQLRDNQLYSLKQSECNVETEIMQLEERTPRYSPYRYPEREKFLRFLWGIEAEKRRTQAHIEDMLRSLENRLLLLMNKHEQIQALDYEYRKTGTKT